MTYTGLRILASALAAVFLLAPTGMAAAQGEPETAEVVLVASDMRAIPLPGGSFLLQPRGEEGGDEMRVEAKAAESALRATVDLPLGTFWRACLEVPGRWAPCEELVAGELEPTHLRALPSVAITGQFQPLPKGFAAPERVILRISAVRPPRQEGFQGVNIGCFLEELVFSCDVPALELDLELRPKGYVPIYRFGVDLPPSGRWDFGSVKLERGGSLVARVETADGEPMGGEAKARLLPFAPGPTGMHLRDRLRRPVAEANIALNGFVQLAALPAGVYSLEVTAPGYAAAFESPLEVWENKEVRLRDPVVLERPLTLEVVVTPPLDWLGRPWHLRLMRASRLTGTYDERPLFDGALDAEGRLRLLDQPAGMYNVQVFDSEGNPLFAVRDREVTGPADAEITVDLELLVVRGSLTYQDEPVDGSLWFGTRHGATHSEMAADLEGQFTGVLPKAGWWMVEIDVPGLDLTRYWTRVEVVPDSRGEAEVEIELPDTEVAGRVVDGEGRAVAGAEVSIGSSYWGRRTETDSDGAFRYIVLEPGPAIIGARHRDGGTERSSDVQEIQIDEEQATPPLELVLQDLKTFAGRVVSARGPVPGAIVWVATVEPLRAAGETQTRADSQGRFEAELRTDSRRLRGVVGPPGHALKAFEAPASDTFEVAVPSSGGTVMLDVGITPDAYAQRELGAGWLLYQEGLLIPHPLLHQWTRGHGMTWEESTGKMQIPQLAAGQYRLCRHSLGDFGLKQPEPVTCAEGYLAEGGFLELELSPDSE